MPRYIEQLNECTDPAAADWLWVVDDSQLSTDKDRKVSLAKFLVQNSGVVAMPSALRYDAVINSGTNSHTTLNGFRSSGLTINDAIRLNFAMANSGNSPTTYAIIEAGVDAFNGGGRLVFYTGAANSGAVERGRIDATGRWGIGTLVGIYNRAVYSDANGYLTNSSSDERLKTDIEPMSPAEALAIVEALEPVRYNWRDPDARGAQREMGLIAQQVEPSAPEVVGANADGMLSLDYAKLVAPLIGAVQALAAEVRALKQQAAGA
jgi:hypothetical protein